MRTLLRMIVILSSAVSLPSAGQTPPAAPIEFSPLQTTPIDSLKFKGYSPGDAARAMTLPAGFRAKSFVAEPDVKQPIAFALDDRGRVWVAEAYAYPIRQPEGQGKDRIVVFEDVDGDGGFDRRTIFKDDLNLISALEIGFGGVWVGAAPHLLFIPMTDGDTPKPAAEPRIVLDGWGYQDTHETLNTLMWGPDGWLYGAQGVFTESAVGKPGTPDAQRTPLTAAIWRYHPTKGDFEVFNEGTSNPWGLDFDRNGQLITEACVIPHLWHLPQGGHMQRQAGPHERAHVYDDIKTIADHVHWSGDDAYSHIGEDVAAGGGHAHAGLMIYQGGSWPVMFHDTAFMNNIHGSRINADRLDRKGSGFVGKHSPDFIRFNDPWSQIINMKYDQDGSMYMIDWYDQEQCHVGSPDSADRANGRVFKVIYGNTRTTRVDLQQDSNAALIQAQLNLNEWHVRHARRVLQERAAQGRVLGGDLRRLRDLLHLDGIKTERRATAKFYDSTSADGQLRLLWALHAVGGLVEADFARLSQHPDEFVRAWAIQLIVEDRQVDSDTLAKFALLARTDPSAVVRMYLASALQRIEPQQRWSVLEALLRRVEDAHDHNQPLMMWYALEQNVALEPRRALTLAFDSRLPRILEFTSRRIASLDHGEPLALLSEALARTPDVDKQAEILVGMRAALAGRRDLSLPKGWERVQESLANSSRTSVADQVRSLSIQFGSDTAIRAARDLLVTSSVGLERRKAALASLQEIADPGLPAILLRLLEDTQLRVNAIQSLASFAEPSTSKRLLDLYPKLTSEEKQQAIATLAARPEFARALLSAVEADRIPLRDVSASTAVSIRALNDPQATRALDRLWGVARDTDQEKKALAESYYYMVSDWALQPADPGLGRRLYQQTCGACHKLFGEGGAIGPDITGSNRASLDYLLHNIVSPNAEIPNAYRIATVQLKGGRVLAGFADQQDPRVLVVRTPTDVVRVPKDDIAALTQADVSMMPEGLLTNMSKHEIRSLIKYLQSSEQVALPAAP